MHGDWSAERRLLLVGRAPGIGERLLPDLLWQVDILLRRRIAAPARSAVDDGLLPFAPYLFAKTAEPILLIHAFSKRLGEARQRAFRKPNLLQTRPSERQSGGTLVPFVRVGDRSE